VQGLMSGISTDCDVVVRDRYDAVQDIVTLPFRVLAVVRIISLVWLHALLMREEFHQLALAIIQLYLSSH
jgi:hypothetical protein